MCALLSCSLALVMFDITNESTPQFFFPFFQNNCYFIQTFVFSNNFLGVAEKIYKLPQYLSEGFCTLTNCPWCLSHSIIREKKVKGFCHWKDSFFLKNLVLDFLCSKKRSHRWHNTCQRTMCALISCSLTFVIFNTTKENTPNFFFRENFAFFSKTCVFNNLLVVTEMIL